jgi:predicted DNA-binding transcriptional regulator AlpA
MKIDDRRYEEAVRLATILPADQHFLAEPDAARWVGAKQCTLARMRRAGKAPKGCRIAGRFVYRRSDLMKWLDQQIKQAA